MDGLLAKIQSSGRAIAFMGDTFSVSLNWLGKLIRGLIEGVGIVGVGIILFSVILKAVVLPFDVYQRVSSQKQNVKMRENKDKLEKLQKQYANDKQMYNQKMMEMYKENGISMFSSCLPAILSIVIFFIAINAFNAYSSYAVMQNYKTMVDAYNGSLTSITATVDDSITVGGDNEYLCVSAEGKYIYYTVPYIEGYDKEKVDAATKTYYVDSDAVYLDHQAEIDEIIEKSGDKNGENKLNQEEACVEYIKSLARKAVKEVYETKVEKNQKFLWIKNIWETDASYKHPILKFTDFNAKFSSSSCFCSSCLGGNLKFRVDGKNVGASKISKYTDAYTQASYNEVTGDLKAQKKQANGYYILIALSIGTILLQQFVSQRTQKEQQQYSTADGQGAVNGKTMMITMTMMFAIFAFMYSASFSIYMITSNLLSLVMTIVINKVVEKSMAKAEERATIERYNRKFRAQTRGNQPKKK